jgi:hypothetical protein
VANGAGEANPGAPAVTAAPAVTPVPETTDGVQPSELPGWVSPAVSVNAPTEPDAVQPGNGLRVSVTVTSPNEPVASNTPFSSVALVRVTCADDAGTDNAKVPGDDDEPTVVVMVSVPDAPPEGGAAAFTV